METINRNIEIKEESISAFFAAFVSGYANDRDYGMTRDTSAPTHLLKKEITVLKIPIAPVPFGLLADGDVVTFKVSDSLRGLGYAVTAIIHYDVTDYDAISFKLKARENGLNPVHF